MRKYFTYKAALTSNFPNDRCCFNEAGYRTKIRLWFIHEFEFLLFVKAYRINNWWLLELAIDSSMITLIRRQLYKLSLMWNVRRGKVHQTMRKERCSLGDVSSVFWQSFLWFTQGHNRNVQSKSVGNNGHEFWRLRTCLHLYTFSTLEKHNFLWILHYLLT